MAQETKTKENNTNDKAQQTVAKSVYGEKKKQQGNRGKRNFKKEKQDEFDQRVLNIARVTRVMGGGKRMSFRASVAIGDKKNKVGVGTGKGADVSLAVNKAVNEAKKTLITVPMVNDTIPHEIYEKKGASKLLFKPAKEGRGIIAGGIVRVILELAGIKNVTSKILGSSNKMNNAACTISALSKLKKVEGNNKNEKTQDKGKKETESNKKTTDKK